MQTVPSGFNQIANGDVIPLNWGIRISFDKAYDDDITWFTLDQSTLNSGDLLAPTEDNPLQAWDFYEYKDFTERLVYMSVQKSIDFPYSVVSAIADFQLNNYDGYFTPDGYNPYVRTVSSYYFDASNGSTNSNVTWSNPSNSYDGNDATFATATTNSSETNSYLEIRGTNTPTSGDKIVGVRIRALEQTYGYTKWAEIQPSSGEWDWAKLSDLSVRAYGIASPGGSTRRQLHVTAYEGGDEGGYQLGTSSVTGGLSGTGIGFSIVELEVTTEEIVPGVTPVQGFILPKRPVRLLLGLSNVLLPQFVGLTEGMPEIGRVEGTATFTAMDFLTWIYELDIRETIAMQDARTDQVLANIFTQFGLAPSQYDLAVGRNTIPFLFFEKDQVKAGDIIRPLMQAEMGRLWLDEQGIIRFTPRLEQPTDPVYILDDDNIEDIEHSGDDEIINRVVINTWVREVQEYQSVYSKSKTDTSLNVIPANSTYVFEASLQDPALTIEDPAFGENAGVSWFTAATPDGVPVTTNVSVDSTELKTNSFNITFNNTNNFAVNIDQLFLWGRPAKNITVEPVVYENLDTDSVDKYEEQVYEINNNFIQDIDDARSLALTMLDEYSEHADIVTVTMSKPNPALQLADIIDIDYEDYSGEYRIIAMNIKLQDAKMTQVLTCRKYTPRHWFTLSQSVLDGTDVLAP